MAEKKFDAQVNYGWGLSLNMTGKAPAVAKRIFDTYADALAYANDVNDSAIEGLVLSVVADDATKNGLYFVKQIATPAIEADEEKGIEAVEAKSAILVKMSTNADSIASADEVLEKLNQEISARTEADETLNAQVTGNTKSLKDLNDNFAEEVKERQAADTYISGVTSGLVSSLNTYKVKDVKSNDTILAVDTDGVLSSELSIDYSSTDKKIYLKGIDDKVISTIDATDFIKDGMLSGVTLDKKEGEHTKMVFTFNTGNSAQTISLDVEEFLNADEVEALESSLEIHKGNTNLHFTTDEKTKLTNLYTKEALDTKFNEINSALTANTEAHAELSSEIASARTDINTISGDVETAKSDIASARTDIDTVSGDVETAKSDISKLQEHVTSADTKFNSIDAEIANLKQKDTELANNINTISGDVKTLTEKVNENEEVVANALTDLKANKVSSLSVEEGSNIVINEVKDENGISYTIGFQWLEF